MTHRTNRRVSALLAVAASLVGAGAPLAHGQSPSSPFHDWRWAAPCTWEELDQAERAAVIKTVRSMTDLEVIEMRMREAGISDEDLEQAVLSCGVDAYNEQTIREVGAYLGARIIEEGLLAALAAEDGVSRVSVEALMQSIPAAVSDEVRTELLAGRKLQPATIVAVHRVILDSRLAERDKWVQTRVLAVLLVSRIVRSVSWGPIEALPP